MNSVGLELTPVLIVMTVMFCALIFGIALIFAIMKRRALEMEVYKKAVDKGLPVPEFRIPKTPEKTLKAALIWIAVGIGFTLLFLMEKESEGIAVGFIPILIGIALIISYRIEKKAALNGNGHQKSDTNMM